MKYGRYLVTMTQRDMDKYEIWKVHTTQRDIDKYEIWKVPCYDDTERYGQI